MEDDDYESLPPESTMSTHMLAGAAAGIMEHSIMYPVDCIKTRMQVLVPDPRANYRSVGDALVQIVRYEGVRTTMRGFSAMIGGAGPAHAMYFACYEKMKKLLQGSKPGTGNAMVHGLAGVGATFFHDAVMNPADVIKQRMQVYKSPYKTCLECGTHILKTEGFAAFYRSFTTQLAMNIPFQSLHFIIYEASQDLLNKDRQYNPKTHIISGAMAGAVAAAATTPLDVCKTLLNTQERCAINKGNAITGLTQACRTIYEFQGLSGFFRGLSARTIYQMPSTAISWFVYELFKYLLTKRKQDSDGFVSPSAVPSLQVHASTLHRGDSIP